MEGALDVWDQDVRFVYGECPFRCSSIMHMELVR